ncbi:MAG: transporter [Anditalea sp.]
MYINSKIALLFLLLNLTIVNGINAQCCSGGVPMSGSLGIASTERNTWSFLLTHDYNVMQDLFESDRSLNDNLRKRTTHSLLLEVNYGIYKNLALTGVFSFVRQGREIQTVFDESTFTATTGLGDAILLVKYTAINPTKFENYRWTIGAGPKFPIGRTNFTSNQGLALPADMQPGTGAWDLMLWTSFERYHLFVRNFNIATALTYRYTGINKDYFGSQEYQFGNEFSFTLQNTYRFFLGTKIFDAILSFRYRNQAIDQIDGREFPNSGGNFIYILPGLSYNFNPNWSISFSSQLPLYRNVGGTQLATSYKLISSVFWRIKRKDKININ